MLWNVLLLVSLALFGKSCIPAGKICKELITGNPARAALHALGFYGSRPALELRFHPIAATIVPRRLWREAIAPKIFKKKVTAARAYQAWKATESIATAEHFAGIWFSCL